MGEEMNKIYAQGVFLGVSRGSPVPAVEDVV